MVKPRDATAAELTNFLRLIFLKGAMDVMVWCCTDSALQILLKIKGCVYYSKNIMVGGKIVFPLVNVHNNYWYNMEKPLTWTRRTDDRLNAKNPSDLSEIFLTNPCLRSMWFKKDDVFLSRTQNPKDNLANQNETLTGYWAMIIPVCRRLALANPFNGQLLFAKQNLHYRYFLDNLRSSRGDKVLYPGLWTILSGF